VKNLWIQIGIVGRPQGLRGAFFVAQRDEDLPRGLKKIRIGSQPEQAQVLTIAETRRSANRPVLQCLELSTREAAEALKMQPIWCDRTLVPLEETSEYLWSDLVGKSVVDAKGQAFGTITAVGNFGASDVVRVDAADGQWTEIPFVSAYFDMNFKSGSKQIQLLVTADTFDDTWNKA